MIGKLRTPFIEGKLGFSITLKGLRSLRYRKQENSDSLNQFFIEISIPLCLVWIIWQACNNRTFEGIEGLLLDIKMLIGWLSYVVTLSDLLEILDLCTFL